MMPFPSILMSGDGKKSYADWQVYIAGLATGGSRNWSFGLPSSGAYRAAPTTGTNDMFGTTWQSFFNLGASSVGLLVRHGLPSEATYNAIVSGVLEVQFLILDASDRAVEGLNRNGYSSFGSDPANAYMTELRYWADGPWIIYPFAGSGPFVDPNF